MGNVMSLYHKNPRILKLYELNSGYYQIHLVGDDNKRKGFLVHRLVAEAFIENVDKKDYVNHLDENKHNKRADNLEWVTASENSRYGTAIERRTQKTTKGGTILINGFWKRFESVKSISEYLNIHRDVFNYKVKTGEYKVFFDDNNPYTNI